MKVKCWRAKVSFSTKIANIISLNLCLSLLMHNLSWFYCKLPVWVYDHRHFRRSTSASSIRKHSSINTLNMTSIWLPMDGCLLNLRLHQINCNFNVYLINWLALYFNFKYENLQYRLIHLKFSVPLSFFVVTLTGVFCVNFFIALIIVVTIAVSGLIILFIIILISCLKRFREIIKVFL